MASFQIEFAKSAARELRKLDRTLIPRVLAAIEDLAEEPRPSGCKKLVGAEHTYRIRIGDYRVVYEVQNAVLVVLVVRIGHRRDVYR